MNGSYSYGQGGGYHYNPNPKRPRRDGDWEDWLGIVVLFLLPFGITQVIAVVWLVSKLRNMTRQQAQNYAFQARQAAEFVKGKAGAAFGGQTPVKRKGFAPGTVKMVVGGVMAGMFALGTIAQLATFVESLRYGFFFADELVNVFVMLAGFGVGLGMLLTGREQRGRMERYTNYLAYIGANRQVSLAPMAAAMDVSVRRLTRDLRKMLATHVLPTGYLDLKAGKLMLTEMGYTEPEPEPGDGKHHLSGEITGDQLKKLFDTNAGIAIAIDSGATIFISGTVSINTDQSLSLEADVNVSISGSLVSYGSITNNGTIDIGDNGYLQNYGTFLNGGTVDNSGTMNNQSSAYGAATASITNNGTINNSGTMNNQSTDYGDASITNNGDINNSGIISNSGTYTGTLPVNTGSGTTSGIEGADSSSGGTP